MKGHLRLYRAFLPAAIVAGLLAWASPAAASTISVTTVASSPGGSGNCTLGEAIQAANTDSAVDACAAGSGSDTISLPSGTYTLSAVDHTTTEGAVALPEIESTITIQGANPQNTIIQRNTAGGTPAFMLFHMDVGTENQCWPTCTLTLKGLSLLNSSGSGGAVTNLAGTVVFDNLVLAGSTNGPAIQSAGNVSMQNALVTNNVSTGEGGVLSSTGTVTVTGSEFEFNSAQNGGVIHLGPSGTATLTDSEFDQNTASAGGALYGPGDWRVTKSLFSSNQATASGGALGGASGDVEVAESLFHANTAGQDGGAIQGSGNLDVRSTTFQENLANRGGGLFSDVATTVSANNTFGGNSAGATGGGLFATGGDVTISNSTFAENFATYGGGFSWEQNSGTLSLRNSLVATNGAMIDGLDCSSDSPLTSAGHNLVGAADGCSITAGTGDQVGSLASPVDPVLAPLDSNGPYTKTFALQTGSPAIDMGNPAAPGSGGNACEQADQRGQVRPRDGDGDETFRCDIGAYEGGIGLPVLTVEKGGTGTGLVDAGSGITCGSDCVESFAQGTSVVLLATPSTDAEFDSWTGCDSVQGDQCTVSMNADRTVTANFTDVESVLSVTRTGSGQGSVTSAPGGINCGLDCSELYPYGQEITLTANPASNSNFHFWSGCDETNGLTCTFTLNEDRSVFASFSPIVRTLSVNKLGSGAGSVVSDPTGISCGSDCGEAYQIGTEVTLTASAGENSFFDGWSGCDSVAGLECTVTVNNHQAVSATFLPAQQILTVTKAGTANGTVTSNPAGISCPGTCSDNFDEGSTVTLTANPDSVAQLDSWSGCDTTNGNTCTVDMDTARGVTATFGPAQRTLTVQRNGSGSGSVASLPTGIDCGSDCSQVYDHATSVQLTATASAGSELTGWTGCTSVLGNVCTVSMTSDKTATATFAVIQRTLTVAKSGAGTGSVSSSPVGISCGVDCTQDYGLGTLVTLTATPGANSVFSGWTGCVSVTNECVVTMDAAKTVTATFGLEQRSLTVSKSGSGTGSVSSSPAGVDCGSDCSQNYDHGTAVTLTPTPGANSTFTSWSGCDSVTGNVCNVTMSSAKNVTATFGLQQRALTLSKNGTGTGTVASSPVGIDCGSDCSQSYDHGTVVTLSPSVGPNSDFGGWNGCTPTTGNDCTVTMDAAKNVTATFTLQQRTLNVSKSGAGNGSVSSSPAGIDCGSDCSQSYAHGTSVTLTAAPDANSALSSWTGCDSTLGLTCTVSMNGAEAVTANFSDTQRNLTVRAHRVAGDSAAGGSVTSDVGEIECAVPNECTESFTQGDVVVLTASPDANNVFVDWTGCDSPSGVTCTMTLSTTKTVTATFHNTIEPSSSLPSLPGTVNTTTRSFSFTANPGSGLTLTAVELWLDGPGAGGFEMVDEVNGAATSGTFDEVSLSEGDGTYEIKTRARNNAGNYETGSTDQFTLDTGVPTSSVSGAATQNKNEFDLNWTVDDASADVELWVNGPGPAGVTKTDEVTAAATTGTFSFTAGEGAGSYSFYSVAEDAAGNREGVPGTPDAVVNVILCPGYETDPRLHLVGGAGNDTLTGTAAAEVICGGAGNDTIKGAGGADLMVGGDGKDTVTYAERTSKQPVIVTINDGNANDGQSGEGDMVGVGVENVTGGKGNDVLTGDGLANLIKGGVGNDTLKGMGGNDKLYGDKGKDKVDGGQKKDTCKTGETYKACEIR